MMCLNRPFLRAVLFYENKKAQSDFCSVLFKI